MSKLDDTHTVEVSDRVLGIAKPLAGLTVAVERDLSVGEIVAGVVIVPLTVFTALPGRFASAHRGRDLERTTTAPTARTPSPRSARSTGQA